MDDGSSLYGPYSYSSAFLLLRLTEGHPKSQRLVERLDIVPQLTKAIPWALLYVVMLVMTLSRNYEHPGYALHLCYLIVFFLHRFLATLPTWVSSVANVWKIVCGAVSTYIGSKAWDILCVLFWCIAYGPCTSCTFAALLYTCYNVIIVSGLRYSLRTTQPAALQYLYTQMLVTSQVSRAVSGSPTGLFGVDSCLYLSVADITDQITSDWETSPRSVAGAARARANVTISAWGRGAVRCARRDDICTGTRGPNEPMS